MKQRLLLFKKNNPNANFLISKPANIYYLTGIKLAQNHREAFLLIAKKQTFFYHSPLLHLSKNDTIKNIAMSPQRTLSEIINKSCLNQEVLFEAEDLTVAELNRLKEKTSKIKFIANNKEIENQREIKDQSEIKRIKEACKITSKTMTWVQNLLTNKPSQEQDLSTQEIKRLLTTKTLTESKLAKLIEFKLYQNGASNLAFPIHVAFDKNTAAPHHNPSKKILQSNSIVMLDFGAIYQGYCADMTRTFLTGKKVYPQFEKVEKTVKTAFQNSLQQLKNSQDLRSKTIDLAARETITNAGYPKNFPHSTGHGLGLEIHESPHISPHNENQLQQGMLITIEPGIYLENHFGYRHEDTILITKTGYQNLTNLNSND